MNNFIVLGPLSCGALIFSECTFTACVNVMDIINWNNTQLVLQTFLIQVVCVNKNYSCFIMLSQIPKLCSVETNHTVNWNMLYKMMISDATAQTGPWPPFTGFMIVFYSTMWGYQLHNRSILDTLIQPSEISSSNYQRLVRPAGKHGWEMAVEFCRRAPIVPIVLVGFFYMP
jgi:hypothetical protein